MASKPPEFFSPNPSHLHDQVRRKGGTLRCDFDHGSIGNRGGDAFRAAAPIRGLTPRADHTLRSLRGFGERG